MGSVPCLKSEVWRGMAWNWGEMSNKMKLVRRNRGRSKAGDGIYIIGTQHEGENGGKVASSLLSVMITREWRRTPTTDRTANMWIWKMEDQSEAYNLTMVETISISV